MRKSSLGLGRIEVEDSRDEKFLLKSVLPKKIAATKRFHFANGWWGNQGNLPHCVGFAWTHYLEDGPISQPGKAPIVDPGGVYHLAQRIDEWEGENYNGTSVRAGVKVLHKLGFIQEYRWAWSLEDVVNALLTHGPVVVGTNWYAAMFQPDEKGFIYTGGRVAGGHAYILNGVDTRKEYVRLKNSWSREWGVRGYAYLRFADLERLLHEAGEACIAAEIKMGKK